MLQTSVQVFVTLIIFFTFFFSLSVMSGFPDALPGDTVSWIIPNTNYTITGHSRAGERTGFCIPNHGIFFDAGIHCWNIPKIIFISHSHTDHSFALPMMTQNLNAPAITYIPKQAVPMIKQHLQSTAQLNACSLEEQPISCTIKSVEPKDSFDLNLKGIHWHIDIIQCEHRVPSVGYCISEKRTKLKEEYKGLKGKEIAQLKKQGIEITNTISIKQFIFMGDTTTKVFEYHPEVFEYSTIFIECTFMQEGIEHKAEKTTHIHWNLLKPYIKNNPQCLFMLIHFSLRWNEYQIEEFITKETEKEGFTNIALWLDKGISNFSK